MKKRVGFLFVIFVVLIAFTAFGIETEEGSYRTACHDGGEEAGCDTYCEDMDSDGYYGFNQYYCPQGNDCNDHDSLINPGMDEVCSNGKDDDCNSNIDCTDDECISDPICVGCYDADGDGFNGALGNFSQCEGCCCDDSCDTEPGDDDFDNDGHKNCWDDDDDNDGHKDWDDDDDDDDGHRDWDDDDDDNDGVYDWDDSDSYCENTGEGKKCRSCAYAPSGDNDFDDDGVKNCDDDDDDNDGHHDWNDDDDDNDGHHDWDDDDDDNDGIYDWDDDDKYCRGEEPEEEEEEIDLCCQPCAEGESGDDDFDDDGIKNCDDNDDDNDGINDLSDDDDDNDGFFDVDDDDDDNDGIYDWDDSDRYCDDDFNIDNGEMTPTRLFHAEIKVLGSAISYGEEYNMKVTAKIKVGSDTIEPWGDFSKPVDSNLNDGNNPRIYITETKPSGTSISITARSWKKKSSSYSGTQNYHWESHMTKSSDSNSDYVKILRDGDPVPQVPGFLDQDSIQEFVSDYVDNGKISLEEDQVIFLFEIGTTNFNSDASDFQDIVVLVTLNDDGEDLCSNCCCYPCNVCGPVDCNDDDPDSYPGAEEVPCDGIDQDCDGTDDNGTDNDSDGYRIEGGACGPIDCNDMNSSIHPGAAELCNDQDDDCDILIDEGLNNESCIYVCQSNMFIWTNNGGNLNCCGNHQNEDSPYEETEESCQDSNDNDCDGKIDCTDDDCQGTQYCAICPDDDEDGYDACNETTGEPILYCDDPCDCDDTKNFVYPDADEIADNGIDDNCDGYIDEVCIEIWLYPGWNLISTPIEPFNNSIEAIMEGCDYNKIWLYNSTTLSTEEAPNETNIFQGYWVDRNGLAGTCTLYFCGIEPESTTICLEEEKNIVGYPSLTNRGVTDVILEEQYNDVWEFYAIEQKWRSLCTGLYDFQPGQGYLVDSTSEGCFTINNN